MILAQETGRPIESYGVSSLYYPNAYLIKGDLMKDSETEYSYDDKRRLIQTDSTVSLSGSVSKLVVNGVTQNYVKTIDEEVSSSQGLYTYNGNDQRVVRTISTEYNEIRENGIDSYTASLTRKYCYSGSAILFESDSSNNKVIHNYLDPEGTVLISKRFGPGSSAYYSFTYDIRGSVSSLYNRDGTAKLNYVYDEYGNIISRSTDTFYSDLAFTGAVYDEDISLYYLNARYYDPSLGVFISRDTYKGSVFSSITHNLYSYTGNNPVNFIDPTGHMMDMIDFQPGGRSGNTGGGVDPNTGKGSSSGSGGSANTTQEGSNLTSNNVETSSNDKASNSTYRCSYIIYDFFTSDRFDISIGYYSIGPLDILAKAPEYFSVILEASGHAAPKPVGIVISSLGYAEDIILQVSRGSDLSSATYKATEHLLIEETISNAVDCTVFSSRVKNPQIKTNPIFPFAISSILTNITNNYYDTKIYGER